MICNIYITKKVVLNCVKKTLNSLRVDHKLRGRRNPSHGRLTFGALSELLNLSSNPSRDHCTVILGKEPFSESASRNPGAVNGYRQICSGYNTAMH